MASVTAPVSAHSTPRSPILHGALLTYLGALAYASLSPFFGWTWPTAFSLFTWPKFWTGFDALINVAAYFPLGLLIASASARRAAARGSEPRMLALVCRSTVFAAAFSIVMELLQSCLPSRVASPLDVLTNTTGALMGVLVFALPTTRRRLTRLHQMRRQHFAAHTETDWGLLLLVLWFFAQLNPAIPFFESGSIASLVALDSAASKFQEVAFFLPQVVGIALNVCGFALFLSLLLRSRERATLKVMVIVFVGLLLKISMASLMFKAPQLAAWLTPVTFIGIAAGLVLVPSLNRIPYRWRALVATLAVFAGGLMAKLTGVYRAFEETMKLFSWPHGHLATFANLTSWVNEIWPLATFLFLAAVFVKREWAEDVNSPPSHPSPT